MSRSTSGPSGCQVFISTSGPPSESRFPLHLDAVARQGARGVICEGGGGQRRLVPKARMGESEFSRGCGPEKTWFSSAHPWRLCLNSALINPSLNVGLSPSDRSDADAQGPWELPLIHERVQVRPPDAGPLLHLFSLQQLVHSVTSKAMPCCGGSVNALWPVEGGDLVFLGHDRVVP
jgi:hypothetical protein